MVKTTKQLQIFSGFLFFLQVKFLKLFFEKPVHMQLKTNIDIFKPCTTEIMLMYAKESSFFQTKKE